MSKPVKDLITNEYKNAYADVNSACVVSVIGLDAKSTNKLRGELRAKAVKLQVVKNSLVRRALADAPLKPLADALDGPCALVTGGMSAIDLAKILAAATKQYPELKLKLGILEGDPDLVDVAQMAKMMGRDELLAEVAMLIASPGRRLAGAINGPGGRLAGCIKAIVEKQEAAA